jgi:hypothetical protein
MGSCLLRGTNWHVAPICSWKIKLIAGFCRGVRCKWKNGRAGQNTGDNIIRRMRFACWITKATDTHSECVILVAFPRQQRLRERASMLGYKHTACLVKFMCFTIQQLVFWYICGWATQQSWLTVSITDITLTSGVLSQQLAAYSLAYQQITTLETNQAMLSCFGPVAAVLEIISPISVALSAGVLCIPYTPGRRGADGTDPPRSRVARVIDRHGAAIGGWWQHNPGVLMLMSSVTLGYS